MLTASVRLHPLIYKPSCPSLRPGSSSAIFAARQVNAASYTAGKNAMVPKQPAIPFVSIPKPVMAARGLATAKPSSNESASTNNSPSTAAKGSGGLSLVFMLLLLALIISTLALYFGNNPLFSPLMKLLVALNNTLNKKLKVSFSDVKGSIRDGTMEFSDFQYEKHGKHKSAKVSLKHLLVQTKESPFEVLKQGIDKKLQDRFTITNYVAEDGTVEIEIRSKGTQRPDPKVRFERMLVRDLKVHFFDRTLPNVADRVAFPVNHIHSLEGTAIHTDSPGTLITDMFLNSTVKGTVGGNPYDLKPKDWQFTHFPIGFIGDFLQVPLRWFSGASADIHVGTPNPPKLGINPVTGTEERIVEFVTRVAFKDLHPTPPKELKAEDLTYLPLVEILKKKYKGEYTIEYTTTLRESELNQRTLQRALTDAMIRDLVNVSLQKGIQLLQDRVLPAAKNALDNLKEKAETVREKAKSK